jgi:hypothetical protein
MKGHRLGYEALDMAMDYTLIEKACRIRLSHKLEKPSDEVDVRRLLGQEAVHSWLNHLEGIWDIHKDLILSLDKVKLLEEGVAGIFISQNEVKQRRTI